MTPKSFWLIIIKLGGVYLFFQALIFLAQSTFVLTYTYTHNHPLTIAFGLPYAYPTILSMMLLALAIIFKSDWIVSGFKLDRNFDTDVLNIGISRTKIVRILFIIYAIYHLVDILPYFCQQVFKYFQQINGYDNFIDHPESLGIIYGGTKILICLIIITCNKLIAAFIERKADDIQFN